MSVFVCFSWNSADLLVLSFFFSLPESLVLSLQGKLYHQACLCCVVCKKEFPQGQGIFAKGDLFYCKGERLINM
jgi:hypothetical protein